MINKRLMVTERPVPSADATQPYPSSLSLVSQFADEESTLFSTLHQFPETIDAVAPGVSWYVKAPMFSTAPHESGYQTPLKLRPSPQCKSTKALAAELPVKRKISAAAHSRWLRSLAPT